MHRLITIIVTYCCFLINLPLAHLVTRPVVLGFHRIKKFSGSLVDQRIGVIDPESFQKIINYLRILGYSFISLEHLINNISKSRLERAAVITFDDGYKDLYDNAYPILKRLNIPFTLFLTTSTVDSKRLLWNHKLYVAIDKLSPVNRLNILKAHINVQDGGEDLEHTVYKIDHNNSSSVITKLALDIANEADLSEAEERIIAEKMYLTTAELLEMEKHGLSTNPHGHEHLHLDYLNRTDTEKEMTSSVQYIRQNLYREPSFYCLTWGTGNQYAIDVAKSLGLKGIVKGEARLVKPFEDAYSLPRIQPTNDIRSFYRQLTRLYLKTIREKMHSVLRPSVTDATGV